jgi:hypothetical protein
MSWRLLILDMRIGRADVVYDLLGCISVKLHLCPQLRKSWTKVYCAMLSRHRTSCISAIATDSLESASLTGSTRSTLSPRSPADPCNDSQFDSSPLLTARLSSLQRAVAPTVACVTTWLHIRLDRPFTWSGLALCYADEGYCEGRHITT